jgi:hypothetical protein
LFWENGKIGQLFGNCRYFVGGGLVGFLWGLNYNLMDASFAGITLLRQLDELLQQFSGEDYCRPLPVLSGATMGQHCRHVIECFEELDRGYGLGVVNYDGRRRDRRVETDVRYARRRIADVANNLDRPDVPLVLCVLLGDETTVSLTSSYYRELYHNLDHAVHHFALMRAGMAAFPNVRLPVSFGVAWSTMKFRAAEMTQKFN